MGRPPVYSDDVFYAFVEMMEEGQLGSQIQRLPGMPSHSQVWRKTKEDAAFREVYARGREMQAIARAENGHNIALSATPENVQVARLQWDAERWLAAKLAPRTFGDRVQQDVTVSGTLDVSSLKTETREELEERLRQLEGDSAPGRTIEGKVITDQSGG